MPVPNEILQKVLTLKPVEKAELIDKLLSSLDMPDKELDELWAKEVEDRITAYEQGKIKAIALEKALEKSISFYRKVGRRGNPFMNLSPEVELGIQKW
jgi:putative addiction module component (TIGR02574 family)